MVILGALISGYTKGDTTSIQSHSFRTREEKTQDNIQLRWITKFELFEENTEAHLNKYSFPKEYMNFSHATF